MNPNVRFGRSIKPLSVKDIQKGSVQILFDKLSEKYQSTTITVGAEPVVIVAFNLRSGEVINVYNVFGNTTAPLVVDGIPVSLSLSNTLEILAVSGVYQLHFQGQLGELVVISYPMSAMNEKAKKSVAITNPNGPQQNRPNLFLDGFAGYSETKEFFVGDVPIVFRAYGLTDQELHLYSVFEDEEEQLVEGTPVIMTAEHSTLIVSIAGAYRFKVVGDSLGVKLVANPTLLNYTDPFLKKGDPGETGGSTLTAGPGFVIVGNELRHAISSLTRA